jgi:hypothetical protein
MWHGFILPGWFVISLLLFSFSLFKPIDGSWLNGGVQYPVWSIESARAGYRKCSVEITASASIYGRLLVKASLVGYTCDCTTGSGVYAVPGYLRRDRKLEMG